MGIRCLFGHDFAEPETERERTEQGEEVVLTVREVRTCARCGERRVVSENKEVTSIDQLAPEDEGESADEVDAGAPVDTTEAVDGDDAQDDAEDDPEEPDARADDDDAPVGSEPAGAGDDTAGAADREPTGVAEGTGGATADADVPDEVEATGEYIEDAEAGREATHPAERGVDDDYDPEADDGVILDAEADATGQHDPTQWPEDADASGARPSEAVDRAREAAAEEAEDGVIVDADGEADGGDDGDDGDGGWPDPKAGEDEGWGADLPDAGDDSTVEAAADAAMGTDARAPPEHEGEREGNPERVEGTDRDGEDGMDSIIANGEAPVREFERTPAESEMEFYCPECGHSAPVVDSSMRAGDICPECKHGYIAERERDRPE